VRGTRYRAIQAYLPSRILDLILCRLVHKGGERCGPALCFVPNGPETIGVTQKGKAACVATSGPSLGRKCPWEGSDSGAGVAIAYP
jgi:hypothetical protein